MSVIANYYLNKYGKPEREAEYITQDGRAVEIYKWTEEQCGEGVTMYATIGANENLGDDQSSCEFFIGITPAADDIVEALAEVAFDGNGTNDVPSSGDTITLAFNLWPKTKAKSFMFTDGTDIIPPLSHKNKNIKFIQLVPLFDEELIYKKKHGEEALWKYFEVKEVAYWNSLRNNSVKGV
ncbi:suppressor of fused domain protein [Kiloniella sp.]|uniref:suppressor of fused domain protein n=1 Tax=Kiloniella sp. TaxID=1938587 RepID=UPI003B01EB0E